MLWIRKEKCFASLLIWWRNHSKWWWWWWLETIQNNDDDDLFGDEIIQNDDDDYLFGDDIIQNDDDDDLKSFKMMMMMMTYLVTKSFKMMMMMMTYLVTESVKMMMMMTYLVTKSFKIVQSKFLRMFNINNYPQNSQIYCWVHKIRTTGSVNNHYKKAENPRSGRKLIARCPDNVDKVKDSVGGCPLPRILNNELQLYPYTIRIKHKLTPVDMGKRLVMCRWFKNKIEEDPDFLDDF